MSDNEKPYPGLADQNLSACLAGIQKDIVYIKEKLDNAVNDHENRLRTIELNKEECQQKERLKVIEANIEMLKKTHDQDEGAEKVTHSLLEYVLAGFAIAEGIIILIQYVGGR